MVLLTWYRRIDSVIHIGFGMLVLWLGTNRGFDSIYQSAVLNLDRSTSSLCPQFRTISYLQQIGKQSAWSTGSFCGMFPNQYFSYLEGFRWECWNFLGPVNLSVCFSPLPLRESNPLHSVVRRWRSLSNSDIFALTRSSPEKLDALEHPLSASGSAEGLSLCEVGWKKDKNS